MKQTNQSEAIQTMRFTIKCDDCKKTIGRTDSMPASVMGGKCKTCKLGDISIQTKDDKAIFKQKVSYVRTGYCKHEYTEECNPYNTGIVIVNCAVCAKEIGRKCLEVIN